MSQIEFTRVVLRCPLSKGSACSPPIRASTQPAYGLTGCRVNPNYICPFDDNTATGWRIPGYFQHHLACLRAMWTLSAPRPHYRLFLFI